MRVRLSELHCGMQNIMLSGCITALQCIPSCAEFYEFVSVSVWCGSGEQVCVVAIEVRCVSLSFSARVSQVFGKRIFWCGWIGDLWKLYGTRSILLSFSCSVSVRFTLTVAVFVLLNSEGTQIDSSVFAWALVWVQCESDACGCVCGRFWTPSPVNELRHLTGVSLKALLMLF